MGPELPRTYGSYYDELIDAGVSTADITYHSKSYNSLVSTAENPTGYGSWGENSGVLRGGSTDAWPVNGGPGLAPQVVFTFTNTLHIGWWIGATVESWSGVYGGPQGDPTEFFAATAFGGTTQTVTVGGTSRDYYTNTPICFVGTTEEPFEDGCEGGADFGCWARGYTTLESAWAGQRSPYYLAVTDVCLDP